MHGVEYSLVRKERMPGAETVPGIEREKRNMNYTYILKCKDGSFYTGWTNNLEKRIKDHNAGKGAKYTKSRCPVELVYYETFATKEEAMRREYAVKQLSRIKKIQLISGENKVAQTLLVEPKNEIV